MRAKTETDILLDRAQSPPREKRYIYGGTMREVPGGYAVRQNRKVVGRRFSTFNVILVLFAVGTAIVLYVNNIIAVNRLAYEVNQLQLKYDSLLNANASLKAELTRKSALERISTIAAENLKLRYPADQPIPFSIDEDMLKDLNASQKP